MAKTFVFDVEINYTLRQLDMIGAGIFGKSLLKQLGSLDHLQVEELPAVYLLNKSALSCHFLITLSKWRLERVGDSGHLCRTPWLIKMFLIYLLPSLSMTIFFPALINSIRCSEKHFLRRIEYMGPKCTDQIDNRLL
jgi:hypothetical protein